MDDAKKIDTSKIKASMKGFWSKIKGDDKKKEEQQNAKIPFEEEKKEDEDWGADANTMK